MIKRITVHQKPDGGKVCNIEFDPGVELHEGLETPSTTVVNDMLNDMDRLMMDAADSLEQLISIIEQKDAEPVTAGAVDACVERARTVIADIRRPAEPNVLL